MSLYKNTYRIESARWQEWDYHNDGAYFVTICTKDRQQFFGFIRNGIMCLNETGSIANLYWEQIPDHFDNMRLGEHIVMPDHVHGIVIIDNSLVRPDVEALHVPPVEALHATSLQEENNFMSSISPKKGSLSVAMRSYKSACKKMINGQFPGVNFEWQARFHDRVIRNETEFNHIENYIISNPKNWK